MARAVGIDLGTTTGSPASRTATTEFVVPRSIPTARAMQAAPSLRPDRWGSGLPVPKSEPRIELEYSIDKFVVSAQGQRACTDALQPFREQPNPGQRSSRSGVRPSIPPRPTSLENDPRPSDRGSFPSGPVPEVKGGGFRAEKALERTAPTERDGSTP